MLTTAETGIPFKNSFTKVQAWMVGVTGLLVLVPALINSGIDIYKATLNIPKTHAESINAQLFQAHFQEDPVTVVPVSISSKTGNMTMQVSIYQNGDVYAEYGFHSQWFPMPQPEVKAFTDIRIPFLNTAYAQHDGTVQTAPNLPYVQQEQMVGNRIQRTRVYENGQVETFEVNTATGEISNRQIQKQLPQKPMVSSEKDKHTQRIQKPIEVNLVEE